MFSAEVRRVAGATVAAMAATGLCWWAVRASGGELSVRGRGGSSSREVPWQAVLFATAVGGVAAYGLVRFAARTSKPRRTFAVSVAAGLTLSSFPPVQAAATPDIALVLLAMHIVAALVIVPVAGRLLRPATPSALSQRSETSHLSGTTR